MPAQKVEAIDTTEAGDAYIGAFVENYVRTGEIRSSLELASAYASLSVTKKGTQASYASKEEFLAYLKRK